MARKYFFVPEDVDEFEAFYRKPYIYLTETPGAKSRLDMSDQTKGWGKQLAETIPLLIQECMVAIANWRALAGQDEQHAARIVLQEKMDALGAVYNKLRNHINNHPDHILADNEGTGLPAENANHNLSPAPVMVDSYPAIDNIAKQLAVNTEMTFHDSGDNEKKHKKPNGQARAEVIGMYTDPKDPVPTQAQVLAEGVIFSATRNPLRINHGADKAAMRFTWVTRWVNTRNIAGMVSDVRSIILG